MKSSLIAPIVIAAFLTSFTGSLAAGITLTNGGLGQLASNPQNFGVAVCNGGESAVSQSVPVSVSVNGLTVNISSAGQIGAGACAYSYLGYNQLGMQAGQTYSVTATIDPAHTVIANSNNSTVYSVTVPAAPATPPQTANVATQSGNFFTMLLNWLASLFK